jgi:hypothetical protein
MSTKLLAKCLQIFYEQKVVAVIIIIVITYTFSYPGHGTRECDLELVVAGKTGEQIGFHLGGLKK